MFRKMLFLSVSLVLLSLGCCGGDGGGEGGPAGTSLAGQTLFTLFVNTFDPQMTTPSSEIVITDVDTMIDVGGFSLPGVWGASLAVSPDGARLYVADRTNGEILVRSAAGADLGSIPMPDVYDLVLNAAGDRLWAASFVGPTIAQFDPFTFTPGPSLVATGLSGGIALSPDETRLAYPAGGGCAIVDASTLVSPTPVSFAAAPCNMDATDTRFATNDRLVVWDSNCDSLHQVDASAETFLPASEVSFGADPAASFNFNNALASAPSSSLVYGFQETGGVWRVDPFPPSSGFPSGFTGTSFLVTPTADGQSLLVMNVIAPITVDRMDVSTLVVSPDVHTFTTTMSYPRDAQVRFVGP